VRLPTAVKARQLEISEMHVLSGPAGKGPLRILIADDLRDSADSLAMELESMGHTVMVAYDGEKALQLCATFRPDVAFLDLGMPKLNGYETCRQIRLVPRGSQITLIAQTGWGQEVDRQKTRDAGFDHHLVKPIDSVALLTLLGAINAHSHETTEHSRRPADPAP
jgi:CheY-like chemotaxis protein